MEIYDFLEKSFIKRLEKLDEPIPMVDVKRYNDILTSFGQKPLEKMRLGDAKVMEEVIEAQTACKNCMPSECPIKGIRVFPLVVNGRIVPDMYMCQLYLNTVYIQLYLNTVYIQRVKEEIEQSKKAREVVREAEQFLKKELYYFDIDQCREVLSEIERRKRSGR